MFDPSDTLCNTLNQVPLFIAKTYRMLDNPAHHFAISWTEQGNGMTIKNERELSEKILPRFFKHNNVSTFVRQLNLYGFKKVKCAGYQKTFIHDDFIRGEPEKLKLIKRNSKALISNESKINNDSLPNLALVSQNDRHKDIMFHNQLQILRHRTHNIQTLISNLLQGNKRMLQQNKNFITHINKMQKQYGRKLEAFIYLMALNLKHTKGNTVVPKSILDTIIGIISQGKARPISIKGTKEKEEEGGLLSFNKKNSKCKTNRFDNMSVDEILQMLEDEEGRQLLSPEYMIQEDQFNQPSPIPSLKSYNSNLFHGHLDADEHWKLQDSDFSSFKG